MALHKCCRMAPKRARNQGSSRPVAAVVEPTQTRSRTVAPATTERPRTGQQSPTATRGRPRTRTRLSRTRQVEITGHVCPERLHLTNGQHRWRHCGKRRQQMTRVVGGRTALKSGCNSQTQMGMEEGTSVICVGPKDRLTITSFPLWSRAIQMCMSIYLTQPVHYPEARAMLKYIQTIRDLTKQGNNWQQGYDESFRALKGLHSRGWDTVVSEL